MNNNNTRIGLSRLLAGLVIFTAAASSVVADDLIDAKGLPFEGAIQDFRDYELTFRLTGTGRDLKRPLAEIRKLTIVGQDAFNQAEALLGKKQYDQAVKAYEQALSAAGGEAWLERLIRGRRYQAVVAGGHIDQAVKDWLAMMDESSGAKAVSALRPATFGSEGSAANTTAIGLLDAKAEELKRNPEANKDYLTDVLTLKMKIQEATGDEEGATKTAEGITGLGGKAEPSGEPAAEEAEPSEESAAEEGETESPTQPASSPPATEQKSDLDVLGRLLKAGKIDDVIAQIEPRLKDTPVDQLPGSLLLLGKAQWAKYNQGGEKDRKLLLKAGLNFMWVYSHFNDEDEAPEALYLAAQVNRELGEPEAVGRALTELVNEYGGEEEEENPWVAKARRELDELSSPAGGEK
jgi:tetratricopeptide (TPR) repeat protein